MAHPLHDHRYQLVAQYLAELRRKRGLLQQDVADRLRRPQGFVSKYESGARRLDVIELLDILQVLDVEPRSFLDNLLPQFEASLPRS
ncbi:helix-turn-helix domain-containing protein [Cupriavidus sp. 30B13]|uniref:helix-turn-helix domain-containing protein n=1 Tax=Cupriavidus sp. 30B13 TaxID=3384241 RepID=UPI003B918C13